jgi:hypothetical protein
LCDFRRNSPKFFPSGHLLKKAKIGNMTYPKKRDWTRGCFEGHILKVLDTLKKIPHVLLYFLEQKNQLSQGKDDFFLKKQLKTITLLQLIIKLSSFKRKKMLFS